MLGQLLDRRQPDNPQHDRVPQGMPDQRDSDLQLVQEDELHELNFAISRQRMLRRQRHLLSARKFFSQRVRSNDVSAPLKDHLLLQRTWLQRLQHFKIFRESSNFHFHCIHLFC
jgi:hypothetical protein